MVTKLTRTAMIAVLLIILVVVSTDTVTKAIAEPDSTDYVHIPESKTERERRTENISEDNGMDDEYVEIDYVDLIT